jgi:hypothetical protein
MKVESAKAGQLGDAKPCFLTPPARSFFNKKQVVQDSYDRWQQFKN